MDVGEGHEQDAEASNTEALSTASIDGRPPFAKQKTTFSQDGKVAAIDPDFESRPQPRSLMESAWQVPHQLNELFAHGCNRFGLPWYAPVLPSLRYPPEQPP